MKSTIKHTTALLLVVANILILPAMAAPDKGKADKAEKKSPAASSEAAMISLDRAKEIALAHAGVDAAGVDFTREDLGRTAYKLKFRNPAAKYEYEISALDGSVLCFSVIPEGSSGTPHSPDLEERPDREPALSADEARQIALDDAGLEEDALKYVTCYLSWSEHAPCAQEVTFSTRTEHYHYTIDLYDGTVLDSSCQSRG